MCFQKCVRETTHTGIGMKLQPRLAVPVEYDRTVVFGSVIEFTGVRENDLLIACARYYKADGIPIALRWKMRTAGCVPEIAEFTHLEIVGRSQLLRGATFPFPSGAERQTLWMRPGAIIYNFPRNKIGAGQLIVLE